MKKLLILPLLLLPILASCGESDDGHLIQLTYGTLMDTTATHLTMSEFETKVSNKENFLLAIHPKDSTCFCWKTFSAILNVATRDNHYKIYTYYVEDVPGNKTMSDMGSFYQLDNAPTFYIIENGKNAKSYNYNMRNPFFNSYDSFLEEIALRCRTPKLMQVNEEQLDELIENENPIVYFARESCSDCNYATPEVIIPYMAKNDLENNLYFFDLDPYRYDKDIYQGKKDKYLLSTAENKKLGHGTGYVPTLQVYENGSLKDMTVFLNDNELTYNQNDNCYYALGSYYNVERNKEHQYLENIANPDLTTIKIKESETILYGESRFWKTENAVIYHNDILKSFLEYYLK